MDQQIIEPDPGLNYHTAILTGDSHFEMKIYTIHITVIQSVARLQNNNCNAR